MAVLIGGIGAVSFGKETKISKLKKGDAFRKIGVKQIYVYYGRYRFYDGKGGSVLGFRFSHYGTDNFPLYSSKKDIDVIKL
jgi:hypothetical protein